MKIRHKLIAALALTAFATLAIAATATTRCHAEDRNKEFAPKQRPVFSEKPADKVRGRDSLPRLGFNGTTYRTGIRVDSVRYKSLAWYAGLESDDFIVSVNGKRLDYRGAWQSAIYCAVRDGGRARLGIRDSRDPYGRIVYATVDLSGSRSEF